LEAEDRLVCFGKLESMRALVPERSRRASRPTVHDLADDAAE
ncbi:MAG: 30S ribosomal protein S6--L-glutamate ligase, partial [Acidimicrobiaceae bacterium]|nr:30S ribosomal protein S6--L-glutamate ligase [Acidimicrobiaceae bacterium]